MRVISKIRLSVVLIILFSMSIQCKSEQTLKEALKNKFLIGVAVNDNQITRKDSLSTKIVIQQFNSITAENCMKSEVLQPEEGKFDFTQADRFVAFGEEHHMFIHGHVLVWHSQTPKWFFVDDKGNDVSREVLIERMRKHITTVVGRYKGRVKSWDVVNEAFNDDGTWRESPYYKIIGKDYIKLAFKFAHEADPNAQMCYNDYSMAHKGRRDAVVNMVNDLKQQGIKVDGIGIQAHLVMDFPTIEAEEQSIIAFAGTGAKVMITEMDLTMLPTPGKNRGADVSLNYEYKKELNPYPNGLPDSVAIAWNNRMAEFFKLFIKHHDKISRVTVWGVSDDQTWRNNWPIYGRKDYPLLFDRNFKPKPIVKMIIKEAKSTKKCKLKK